MSASPPADGSDPTVEPAFPPGQDSPGFIAFGIAGVASEEQGNVANITKSLRRQIVFAERNCSPRLTWTQIQAKYDKWTVKQDTLRGIDRTFRLDPEQRRRVVAWTFPAIDALKSGVAQHTKKGKIAWRAVSRHILDQTDKVISVSQARAKWEQIVQLNGRPSMSLLDPMRPVVEKRRLAAKKIASRNDGQNEKDLGDNDPDAAKADANL